MPRDWQKLEQLFAPPATGTGAAWSRLCRAVGQRPGDDWRFLAGLSPAEWEALLAEATLHWCTPLLYRTLAPHREALGVPAPIWRGFKRIYLFARARARRSETVMAPVLAAFAAAGLPVIVLKGLYLSQLVYPDAATRPMTDVDLLVRREDLAAAASILETCGFHQKGETPSMQAHAGLHHLERYWHPHGPPIELHYDLAMPTHLPASDLDRLWHRARPARICGAEVLVLSPEDTLLHLCMHAALNHLFGVKLLSLCDMPLLLDQEKQRLDWPLFWQQARQWGASRSAAVTLALVPDRLGYPLPEGAAGPLRPLAGDLVPLSAAAEAQMRRRALIMAQRRWPSADPNAGPAKPAPDMGEALRTLWRSPSWRDRAAAICQRVFIPQAELAARFGLAPANPWVRLLYPVRLVLMLARHGRDSAAYATIWLMRRRGPDRFIFFEHEPTRQQQKLELWLRGGEVPMPDPPHPETHARRRLGRISEAGGDSSV